MNSTISPSSAQHVPRTNIAYISIRVRTTSNMQTQPLPAGSIPNPRTVSLAIAIILLVVGIGAGAGGTYLATHLPSTATSTNALCYSLFVTNPTGCVSLCTSGKTVTIGELDRKSTRLNSSHITISY